MDLQLALVSALVKEGQKGLDILQTAGIEPSYLSGTAKDVLEFINSFSMDYDRVPSKEIIFGKLDIKLPDVAEPLSFFIEEMKTAKLHSFLNEHLDKAIQLQNLRNPYKTVEALEDLIIAVKEQALAPSAVEEMGDVGPDALKLYERFESNQCGILTPWKTLNDISMGFWEQDLIIIASRSGIGKTWSMILLAQHAYEVQKKRILFISPEMPRERLSLRFNAIKHKLPYDLLSKGKLEPWQRKKLYDGVAEMMGSSGFGVVASKNFDYKVSSLAALIARFKPHVVYVDGVYLLQANGGNRLDQAANLMNDMKRLAIRFNIPIIISTQFNKEVDTSKEKTVKGTGIAMTDVANWNNSMAFGLFQDEDMKAQRIIELKVLKAREGIPQSVKVWWDFQAMNFSEIQTDKKDADQKKQAQVIDDPFQQPQTMILDGSRTQYEPDESGESPF